MRGCLLSLALFALIIVGFIVGVIGSQPGLMIVSFVASPLVWFIGGWSARGMFNGRRLTFVEVEGRSSNPATSSQRTRRLQTQERPAEQTL